MKKTIMTIAIFLGLGLTAFADPNGGGLFKRGAEPEHNSMYSNSGTGALTPMLPEHGQQTNQNAPLGTGIAVLAALGGAYLVGKRRKQE